MQELTYTLLADGSSDAALMPIINWLLRQYLPDCRILPQFAEGIGPVGLGLNVRLPVALKMYPCDLLFIHRDVEGESVEVRLQEIAEAMRHYDQVYVPVIPQRMSEAWLLSDEAAIRQAAGNKRGQAPLNLPSPERRENRPDPKADLMNALLAAAAEKSARAQAKMNLSAMRLQVADFTDDFSGLRGMVAFDLFEFQLTEKLEELRNALD